jgi:predicted esterase
MQIKIERGKKMNRWFFALLTLVSSANCYADMKEQVITVPTRGTVVSYLLSQETSARPDTVFILFSGGTGEHNLSQRGDVVQIFNDQKYLARTRKSFVDSSTATVLLDTPEDKRFIDDAFRMSESHAADVQAVIGDLRKKFGAARIVLVGHSNGSISVAHVARRIETDVSKVVLVNGRLVKHWYAGDGLATFDFSQLKTELLLVHHAKDGCTVTPYEGAVALAARHSLITVHGPDGVSTAGCNGGTHNMTGKDVESVGAILDWVKGVKGAPFRKDI